jgi:hypothetical protein
MGMQGYGGFVCPTHVASTAPKCLSQNFERFVARATVAIYGEISVEARGSADPKPFHDCKAGSVDEGKILIRKGLADCPGALEVGGRNILQVRYSFANLTPEIFGSGSVDVSIEKRPCLDQDIVCQDRKIDFRQDPLCAPIVSVADISGGKPQ